MGKQKSYEYAALAEQIKPLMPIHPADVAITFGIPQKKAEYIIRHFIGINEQQQKVKPTLAGKLWGQSKDDCFIEPKQ